MAVLPIETSLQPHILFFGIYNAIYYVPLLLAFVWGYGEGGVDTFTGFSQQKMIEITYIYMTGLLAFILGANLTSALQVIAPKTSITYEYKPWLKIELSDKLAVFFIVACFLASKIAIIPLGVYRVYAFDSGQMSGGLWSFSTFCSEALLFIAILVLFSNHKRRFLVFSFLSLVNCINLLHGTRIFFISTVLAATIYAYIRGHLPIRRVLIVGPIAFVFLLGITYSIFLARSSISAGGSLTAAKLLSPLVYESVFSQISLVGTLNNSGIWNATGSGIHFGMDALLNAMPRFLVPDKESMLYIDSFNHLSPLGGFSGYAQGLIYFGLFFPVFYFLIGFFASFLYRKAKSNGWWLIIYIYFTADFLFRINRDGYLIPIKGLINCIQIVFILIIWRKLFQKPSIGLLNR